jgi:serralysin
MAGTQFVSDSGNPEIDALLTGYGWDTYELTYSFPTSGWYYVEEQLFDILSVEQLAEFAAISLLSGIAAAVEHFVSVAVVATVALNGFEEFNEEQKEYARYALDQIAAVTLMSFDEDDEGFLDHETLRFAETDTTSAPAFGIPPLPTIEVLIGNGVLGDAWFDADVRDDVPAPGDFDEPVLGNFAAFTILHETGHILGLKHGHESGLFGDNFPEWLGALLTGVSGPALPTDKDSHEFSVMTYRSEIGGEAGAYNTRDSYPQSLMMLDIQALQYMYGADYNTAAGNTHYMWDPATGQMFVDSVARPMPAGNKIFLTIWDGNGNDTYDLSNYSNGVLIDLAPGGWTTTSQSQLADLNRNSAGGLARGNIANALLYHDDSRSLIENAIGGSGHDEIKGNRADNILIGNDGNDTLSGYDGADVLDGNAGRDTLHGGDGDDQLFGGGDADTVHGDGGKDLIQGNSGIDELHGGDHADRIFGGADGDAIFGDEGADEIDGDGGADVIEGGGGGDLIRGGEGADNLRGGDANDRLFGGPDGDTISGDAGQDLIEGDGGSDTLRGGDEQDTIRGGQDDDFIFGDAGADFLEGQEGADTIHGGAEADIIHGNEGADTLDGDDGADTIYGGDGDDVIRGAVGSDQIWGDVGIDTISGGDDSDTLFGGADNDFLYGNAADDVLAGGDGGDVHDGGDGFDSASYADSAGPIVLNMQDPSLTTGFAQGDTFISIENFSLSEFDDTFIGSNDPLIGDVVSGAGGADTLLGFAGDDFLDGGEGDDFIDGGEGADRIIGGDGFDTTTFAASTIGIVVDLLDPSRSTGLAQGDVISGVEKFIMTAQNDEFVGSAAGETVIAGDGNDSIFGGEGSDMLYGGLQHDLLDGGAQNDFLFGEIGNDILRGGAGEDQLDGGADHDSLNGGSGADVLRGGTGNDYLAGDQGSDLLFGGEGKDHFVFATPGWGVDRIMDFTDKVDTVDINGLLRPRGSNGMDQLTIVERIGIDGQIESVVSLASGGPDQIILVGVQAQQLSHQDFLFG